MEDAIITCLGAGSAAIACMRLLVSMGARRENIFMVDRRGVIYEGREGRNVYKEEFANHTAKRTLKESIDGGDVFNGLLGSDWLPVEMIALNATPSEILARWHRVPES